MTMATNATTSKPNEKEMNVRWLVICDTFQSDAHTHTRAPITFCFRIKIIKTNRFRLQWGIVVSGWVANDTIRTTGKYKRSTEKKPAWPQWMVRGVWYGSLWVLQRVPQIRAHAFFPLPANWYVSFGSRRTTKSEFSRAAAAHEINEIKYQVYECIDLICRIAKDICSGSMSQPQPNYVVTATHCKYAAIGCFLFAEVSPMPSSNNFQFYVSQPIHIFIKTLVVSIKFCQAIRLKENVFIDRHNPRHLSSFSIGQSRCCCGRGYRKIPRIELQTESNKNFRPKIVVNWFHEKPINNFTESMEL